MKSQCPCSTHAVHTNVAQPSHRSYSPSSMGLLNVNTTISNQKKHAYGIQVLYCIEYTVYYKILYQLICVCIAHEIHNAIHVERWYACPTFQYCADTMHNFLPARHKWLSERPCQTTQCFNCGTQSDDGKTNWLVLLRLGMDPTWHTNKHGIPVGQPPFEPEHEQVSQAGSQAGCAN